MHPDRSGGRRGLSCRGGCGGRSHRGGGQGRRLRRGCGWLVLGERTRFGERGGDGFHHGIDGGMVCVDLLEAIECVAHFVERFGPAVELRSLRAFDAMKNAHRLGDGVGYVHQFFGNVTTALQCVERRGELLSCDFCELYNVGHGFSKNGGTCELRRARERGYTSRWLIGRARSGVD